MTVDFEHYHEDVAAGMTDVAALGGALPAFLGIRVTDVGPGTFVAEMDVRDELKNPFGSAHGGVISSLVDHVLGAVLYPVMPKGSWAATTEFKVNLLRAVRGGVLRAEATIASMGKQLAVVQIEVTNDGVLAALAQGTVMIVPPKEP